jgi:flavin reductase (DIM6/NTAB) family NADH-FMN oxidoreductase RutF
VLIVPSALKDAFVDLSTKPDELVKAVCPYMNESKLLYSCKIKNSRQIINETILIIENINQYRLRIITQN